MKYSNYKIPDHINKMITREFLEILRDELYKVNNMSLEDFHYDSLAYYEGTCGWNVAFGLACIKNNSHDLYNYSETLEWFDWDIFCGDIGNLLEKNNLILPKSFDDYISETLNLNQEEFCECSNCGKRFLIKNMEKKEFIENKGEKMEHLHYVCNRCIDIENNENSNANKYYLEGLKLIKEIFK